jgi:hypothetical protein
MMRWAVLERRVQDADHASNIEHHDLACPCSGVGSRSGAAREATYEQAVSPD